MGGRLLINGRIWEGDTLAEWKDGILSLPLSVVAERLGARMQRTGCTDLVQVEKDGRELALSLGQQTAFVQGERVPAGGAIYVNKDMIMVPAALISRYFGLSWRYVEDINAVVLNRTEPALKDRLIALDAGHGGEETGAISGDLVESELNWDVVQRLACILTLSGAEVQYTRGYGETMSLPQRVNLVMEAEAELLVSIHHNSFLSAEINGTETYWYHSWSAHQLADCIQNHLLEELRTTNRGIREAAFFLLRHSFAVPVLIKVGFLTGSHDSTILADRWTREKAALGIFRGIREYIEGRTRQL